MSKAGGVVMVRGPAKITITGDCRILGMDVSNQQLTIRAGKALPLEVQDSTQVDVEPGEGSATWTANPSSAGTSIWRATVSRILSSGQKTVLLVGETDTGKSTLSMYLANTAIENGLTPCIIDGDIGQGDLAPPGAIGTAIIRRQLVDLRDAKADLFEFIGSISSAGFERLIAAKIRSALSKTRHLADIQIVNTDGYVSDGGLRYKAMLARMLRPTAVICLGQNDDLYNSLKSGPWMLLRAKSGSETVKTRFDRLGRRAEQFNYYLGTKSVSKDLAGILFSSAGKVYSWRQVYLPQLFSMFVGLESNNRVVGFGLITGIKDSKISLQTDIENFDMILLSSIFLPGATGIQRQDP